MLPSILHIAEEFNLTSDPKTYGKKESLFKCPFCEQDSTQEKKHRYYLSLNTDDNVFKCWYCKKSGGVLKFESILANEPYEKVRKRYFGKRKENLHPAYELSPDQLKRIGWQDEKRQSLKSFQLQKEKVIDDWKMFEFNELTKHYALLTLIAHFPIEEKKKVHYEWFNETCQLSEVDNLDKKIIQQWNSKIDSNWSVKGTEIARKAYSIAVETGDFEFSNMFVNVLFVQNMMKLANGNKGNSELTPVSI